MIGKYPGLMQVMRGRLEHKLNSIMGADTTAKQYKDFLIFVAKELKIQEKMKQIKLKNNLYDTVLYYLERRSKSSGSTFKRSRKSYKSKLRNF